MDYCRLTIVGRLTGDPELKNVGENKSVLTGSIAYTDRYNSDYSHFIQFNIWGKVGEVMSKYLRKGSKVLMEGSLRQDRWEANDEKRSAHKFNVEQIIMLDTRKVAPEVDSPSEETTSNNNAGELESVPF